MKYLTAFLSQFSNSQESLVQGTDRTDTSTPSGTDGKPTPWSGGKVLPFILPAPNASALPGHCTRLRRNTAVSANDVQALAQHFEALGREDAIASERRLWAWWLGSPLPSVAAFLALEPKEKGPSHA